ncbi:MAG: hypothetical protein IH932_04180 [Thaumarchaeota archaeon]|nr:hypothetical protein [Nitrososphaerota archaeon]
MANIAAVQELQNGARHLVLKLDIKGDGSSELDEVLVDVNEFNGSEVRLDWVKGNINGFRVFLEWDGTTLVPFLTIEPGNYIDFNWRSIGGLVNPKMANFTGNVKLTTIGLDNEEQGSLTFGFYKKRIP